LIGRGVSLDGLCPYRGTKCPTNEIGSEPFPLLPIF
jgi:hypothetical protein